MKLVVEPVGGGEEEEPEELGSVRPDEELVPELVADPDDTALPLDVLLEAAVLDDAEVEVDAAAMVNGPLVPNT